MKSGEKNEWGFLESSALLHGKTIALQNDTYVIGSAPGSDILLNDPAVSRRHALLRRAASQCELTDLGSRNGTFVNGRRITNATALGARSIVQVGDAKLVFVASSARALRGRRLLYAAFSLAAIGGVGFALTSVLIKPSRPSVVERSRPMAEGTQARGSAASNAGIAPAPDHTSEETGRCAKIYAQLEGLSQSGQGPQKDFTRDAPEITIKHMRTDFNASVSQFGKIGACGFVTRGGCGVIQMYNDPRIFGMSPDLTPAERRQFEKIQNAYAESLAACQRILDCDVVSCSELGE